MNMWPQALMAIFLLTAVIIGFVNHGKTNDKPIDRGTMLSVSLWIALVLGAGGFWNPK